MDSQEVAVRIAQPLLGQLDDWREAQPDQPARPEAVRRILGQHLDGFAAPAAKIADQIEAQKEVIGALPPSDPEPSPEAAMNVMRRAVAENELVEMKNVRRKAKRLAS